MQNNLIYDVGMHNGNDTAFYLALGYRVVAVEADPTLVAAARVRFAHELAEGRVNLVHAGIAESEGVMEFFLCEGKSEFNSFDRANATRYGRACRAIHIPSKPFSAILAEYGVPYYLKIDIETFDRHCVAALDPKALPQYISCELSETEQIEELAALGYDAFKLVWQRYHRPVLDETRTLSAWFRATIEPIPPLPLIMRNYRSLHDRSTRAGRRLLHKWGLFGPENRWGWKFPHGSSGPFGEDAPGRWIDRDEALYRWLAIRKALGTSHWVDVHATCLSMSSENACSSDSAAVIALRAA